MENPNQKEIVIRLSIPGPEQLLAQRSDHVRADVDTVKMWTSEIDFEPQRIRVWIRRESSWILASDDFAGASPKNLARGVWIGKSAQGRKVTRGLWEAAADPGPEPERLTLSLTESLILLERGLERLSDSQRHKVSEMIAADREDFLEGEIFEARRPSSDNGSEFVEIYFRRQIAVSDLAAAVDEAGLRDDG